ncbi:MAG: TPM domain-containing protein [Acidobacteriota bacterium]|nr:TPM domain-containing protein [Acidobacteriota bacterium]
MRTGFRTPLRWTAWAVGLAWIICLPLFPAEKPDDVPNPLAAGNRFVGDNAAILGPEYLELIDAVCHKLENATTSQLAVITVKDLGGMTIDDFAVRLFRRFGIGFKGKDNGVLILCALKERDVRIEVGYGLEGVLTDAVSSRLLDEEAVPFLAKDEFGHGLYALAKGVAGTIATAQGVSMEAADPSAWPAQPAFTVPTEPTTGEGKSGPTAKNSGSGPLILAGLAALWGLIGTGAVYRKYNRTRGKAVRAKAIDKANGVTGLLWTGAGAGFIGLLASHNGFGASLLSLLSPTAVTIGQGLFRKSLRRRLDSYHLPCAKCGAGMDLTPEDQDDALLSVEEAAEEKAGGMDYEIWTCPSCAAQERLSVEMNKARECPKCKRRTLKETSTTLETATTSHGGRVRVDRNCLNPKCRFAESRERLTPKLSTTTAGTGLSGSSHSSVGSSHSSFGGGRSGGGGASRHF